MSRALGQIRTADTRFRRAVLYPLSYEGGVRPTGHRRPERNVPYPNRAKED